MKLYIFTQPKAGTYFLAGLAARLGFADTGWHVSFDGYLDTRAHDLDTNVRHPSRTAAQRPAWETMQAVPDRGLLFGHCPLPLMPMAFPAFSFLCAYRHPRRALVSEFVDFRFRRRDVDWAMPEAEPDDRAAFLRYLEFQAPQHLAVLSDMLSLAGLVADPLAAAFAEDRFAFVDFERLRADPQAAAGPLSRLLCAERAAIAAAHAATLAAETKTKATDLDLDRTALWTPAAEAAYRALEADLFVAKGRALGWTF